MHTRPATAAEVLDWMDVSRETSDKLYFYVAAVERWTKAINLVSKSSVPDLWVRHVLDSAQIHALAPVEARHWLDIGSGGGFPGVVCALLSADAQRSTRFTLVESDRRKCAFLTTMSRELDLGLDVQVARIEDLPPQQADVVSARALAPLSELLGYARRHASADAHLLFPKGARVLNEIQDAEQYWRFTHELHQSITDPDAHVITCSLPQRI